MKIDEEKLKHYYLGTNNTCYPGKEQIIKMSEPRVFIQYSVEEAYPVSFEEFWKSVAFVQRFGEEKPTESEKQEIFLEAWNFLCLEEEEMRRYMDEHEV